MEIKITFSESEWVTAFQALVARHALHRRLAWEARKAHNQDESMHHDRIADDLDLVLVRMNRARQAAKEVR